ncbi:MAG: hypothetical protein M3456_06640 [Actinomycetota bacterium]|nr:hypothetical protein [Actinomycetota bacterium]
MPDNPNQDEPVGWQETLASLDKHAASFPNAELLASIDLVLLELERRLLHYARVGPEVTAMADEGLVLSARAAARLRQAQSATAHAAGHLQVVGVGNWRPQSTSPSWSDDPRVGGDET